MLGRDPESIFFPDLFQTGTEGGRLTSHNATRQTRQLTWKSTVQEEKEKSDGRTKIFHLINYNQQSHLIRTKSILIYSMNGSSSDIFYLDSI